MKQAQFGGITSRVQWGVDLARLPMNERFQGARPGEVMDE